MPELPEVEIIKRQLSEYLIGHVVEEIDVLGPQVVRGEIRLVIGGRVEEVERYGKGFVIRFDNGYSLAVHLKMTGQMIYRSEKWKGGVKAKRYRLSEKVGRLPGPHTRVIFHLSDGAKLYYNDIRTFGWLHVLPSFEVENLPFIKNLGPDALEKLSFDEFTGVLCASRSAVKNVIMDQRRMSGIGNIYANDALWKAGIDPRRGANTLSEKEMMVLFDGIRSVLAKGIDVGAASANTYVDALGQEGGYQDHFLVYQRVGGKCFRCGGVIEKFMLGGRGTFWCLGCQI